MRKRQKKKNSFAKRLENFLLKKNPKNYLNLTRTIIDSCDGKVSGSEIKIPFLHANKTEQSNETELRLDLNGGEDDNFILGQEEIYV